MLALDPNGQDIIGSAFVGGFQSMRDEPSSPRYYLLFTLGPKLMGRLKPGPNPINTIFGIII